MPRAQEVQRCLVIRFSTARRGGQVTISLSHDDEIGEFHHAALYALKLIAAGRRDEHHKDVRHIRNGYL